MLSKKPSSTTLELTLQRIANHWMFQLVRYLPEQFVTRTALGRMGPTVTIVSIHNE